MNIKKIFLSGLIVVLMLTENCLADSSWKETEISRQVLLPQKIEIVPPAKDLSPKVAAFLGRWEGVWDTIEMPVVLIVESISSTTANVIYCTGRSKMWGNKPDYSRRKAKVFLREKTKIEFPVWGYDRGDMYVYNLPLEMGEDLKTLHGVFRGRDTSETSITMKKIED